MPQISRESLRKKLIELRRQLAIKERSLLNKKILSNFIQTPIFQQSKNIAFYIPMRGEVDILPVIEFALKKGKNCYLPILQEQETENNKKSGYLLFGLCNQHTPLQKNKYGISEPVSSTPQIAASELDLAIIPIVGFDLANNRLGFGAGYYDRTFAFKNNVKTPIKPYLIGVAYELQKVEILPVADWDVKMDLIITNL